MQTQPNHRLKVILAWSLALALAWWSLHPLPLGLRLCCHLDKLAHFGSFALVGGLWFRTFASLFWRPLGLGYGVLLEIGQAWVPGRTFDHYDLAANLAGIALAWGYAHRYSLEVA